MLSSRSSYYRRSFPRQYDLLYPDMPPRFLTRNIRTAPHRARRAQPPPPCASPRREPEPRAARFIRCASPRPLPHAPSRRKVDPRPRRFTRAFHPRVSSDAPHSVSAFAKLPARRSIRQSGRTPPPRRTRISSARPVFCFAATPAAKRTRRSQAPRRAKTRNLCLQPVSASPHDCRLVRKRRDEASRAYDGRPPRSSWECGGRASRACPACCAGCRLRSG